MKIYTKTGDDGLTSSWSGQRVDKSSLEIEVIGIADELISWLGVMSSEFKNFYAKEDDLKDLIELIQNRLFNICAVVSANEKKLGELNTEEISDVSFIEALIDRYTDELPALTNFVLPGGSELGAKIHYSRATMRTFERRLVQLKKEKHFLLVVIPFVNRCSDLFFTLGRLTDFRSGAEEIKVAYAKNPRGN